MHIAAILGRARLLLKEHTASRLQPALKRIRASLHLRPMLLCFFTLHLFPCSSFVSSLLLVPVVRRDAFYALLFCLAVRIYVSFSPRLSRGLTGWVGGGSGWGGGGGLDSVLSPASCGIFVSTRS